MSAPGTRLLQLLRDARDRNLRATFAHIDVATTHEAVKSLPVSDSSTVDRFTREHIEGALCWRDRAATRPSSHVEAHS